MNIFFNIFTKTSNLALHVYRLQIVYDNRNPIKQQK